MMTVFLIAGLAAFIAIPLVSVLLFIMGFGGLVNTVASNEYEEDDNG